MLQRPLISQSSLQPKIIDLWKDHVAVLVPPSTTISGSHIPVHSWVVHDSVYDVKVVRDKNRKKKPKENAQINPRQLLFLLKLPETFVN
eukprot:m.153697 g.153697  ORF g.153697 m.153697 type:complete len:89 (-) comp14353_c0_seq10:545-811(-)